MATSLETDLTVDAAVLPLGRREPVAVAIVDVVPSYRLGLSAAFAEARFAIEEPVSLDEWIRLPGPRVLVVTVEVLGDCDVIRRCTGVNPDLSVLALLRDPTAEMYIRALQAGAAGAAPWTASPEAIIAVVEAARHQHVLLPQEVVQEITASALLSAELRAIGPSDVEWLQMMAQGKTVAELARAVGYSEREMFRLLRQLYDRMGVRNRTEALLKAARCGLLP